MVVSGKAVGASEGLVVTWFPFTYPPGLCPSTWGPLDNIPIMLCFLAPNSKGTPCFPHRAQGLWITRPTKAIRTLWKGRGRCRGLSWALTSQALAPRRGGKVSCGGQCSQGLGTFPSVSQMNTHLTLKYKMANTNESQTDEGSGERGRRS